MQQQKRKALAKTLKDDARGGAAARPQFPYDALRQHSLMNRVHPVLKPGKLYSVPARAFNARPLGHAGMAQHRNMDVDGVGDLELDVERYVIVQAPERPNVDNESVFFRVISTRPGRGHFVDLPVAAGAGRHLLADDMCLTVHQALMTEGMALGQYPAYCCQRQR